jgi:flagellin
VDLATDLATAGNAVIATTANTGANFQIGATGNAVDALGVTFADARVTNNTSTTAGYGTLAADIATFATATGNGNGIVAAAQTLINSTDVGISFVSTVRGNLGAVQNRLEHTTASISVASENLNASESRIRDLDVASEMVNFTKTQILQQAGTAILAQANSAPQNIMTLLR